QPIQLSSSAQVRVKQFDASGQTNQEHVSFFEVNDTTPPQVKSVTGIAHVPSLRIEFSESVRKADAESTRNYTFVPSIEVKSATLSEDGTSVALALAKPPSAEGHGLQLSIANVRDISPKGNPIATKSNALALQKPVYVLDAMTCDGKQSKEIKLDSLPVKKGDSWTINLFARVETELENRTIIAGFGRAEDGADGIGRYICKFGSGVHFWSRNRDVNGRRNQLDLKAWQMLTATYDGETLRLYKNGRRIAQRNIELNDDESIVQIAPLDPWDQQRRFNGEIRNFTIWNTALAPDALRVLQDSQPANEPTVPGQGQ
ncbi:MAG: hypothetical protein H7Z14_20205, partial [Anaerolineae bacterium]|nr:hypothetical protein [Phycisphaerae bacterium]